MRQQFETLLPKIRPLLNWLRKYGAFVVVIAFLGLYVYLVQYIGGLIQDEPSQAAVDSTIKPVNRLKIDQDAVQKMTDLESQNIEIQSLFDQARQNPFTE